MAASDAAPQVGRPAVWHSQGNGSGFESLAAHPIGLAQTRYAAGISFGRLARARMGPAEGPNAAEQAHQPTRPSTSSRIRSACPLWRAYSSIMWT
jgi:hypothetical protein